MTLIVARKTADGIQMVADTQVSDQRETHIGPIRHGVLKCIALSPSRCIGFAGNLELAKDALRWCFEHRNVTDEEIRRHLLRAHQSSHADTDFIFATLNDGGSLDRVTDHSLQQGLEVAHIGEHAAFELYQRFTRSEAPWRGAETHPASKMREAFSAVIEEGSIRSVGGFAVSVGARQGGRGFRYLPYAHGSGFRPVEHTTEPTSMLRTLGAQGGSYNYSVLVPSEPGVGAIGIYVQEGSFGAFFNPVTRWVPVVIREVRSDEFIAIIDGEHHVKLVGIGFT